MKIKINYCRQCTFMTEHEGHKEKYYLCNIVDRFAYAIISDIESRPDWCPLNEEPIVIEKGELT